MLSTPALAQAMRQTRQVGKYKHSQYPGCMWIMSHALLT